MAYSAFISYSHDADASLATALRIGLHRFAKPWYQRRAVRVFQDASSIALDPSLWDSVRRALDVSEYLILLASPQSARSPWVAMEVEYWLQKNGLQTLLLVQTHGSIRWDPAGNIFDPETTDALPASLLRAYRSEPLYLDLSWVTDPEQYSLRHPRFRDAVASLQAILKDQPKDELIGEDVHHHRIARRLAWFGGSLITVLAVVASLAAFFADQQRRLAEQQRDTARARLLGVQAQQLLDQNPDLVTRSVLLAIEAVRQGAGPQSEHALRRAVALLPQLMGEIPVDEFPGRTAVLAFEPTGRHLVIGGDRGLGFWDVRSGKLIQLTRGGPVAGLEFDSSASALWALRDNNIERLDTGESGASQVIRKAPYSLRRVVLAGDGGWIAWPDRDGSVRVESVLSDSKQIRLSPLADSDNAVAPLTIAFNGNGSRLASIDSARAIDVWELPSATRVRTIAPPAQHSHQLPSLALSPGGDRLAAVRGDSVVEIWRLDEDAAPQRIDHGGDITHLRFSTDGQILATAGNGAVRLWDLAGVERFRIPYENGIETLEFSADGNMLAVAGRYHAPVRVWDLGARRAGMAAIPVERVNAVSLSPDSRLLASAEDEGIARVWDLVTGEQTRLLQHPPATFSNSISRLMFAANESQVTATTSAGESTIWRVRDGEALAQLSTPGLGYSSQLNSDGSLIAGLSGSNQTQVWNIRSGERLAQIEHEFSDWRPLVSPDSRLVAVKRKSEIYIYSLLSGEQSSSLEINPEFEIRSVAFSPDARFLAIGGEDKLLTVRDLARDKEVAQIPHTDTISELIYSNDGKRLATTSAGGLLRIFATDSWQEILKQQHTARLQAFAMDNSRVASVDQQRVIRVRDVQSGRLLLEQTYPEKVQLVSLRPGSNILVVAGRSSLSGISVEEGVTLLRERYLADITALLQSPSGRYLAVGFSDGDVQVRDMNSNERPLVINGRGAADDVQKITFSPDGKTLVTVAEQVHVWDLSSGAERHRFGTDSFGGVAAHSADGRYLGIGDSASLLRVWDLSTDTPLQTLKHDTMISSVAFSADSQLVAATGPPSTLANIWRVATGELVRTIAPGTGEALLWTDALFRIAFHPDGKRIITAARDGSVRFWDVENGQEVGRLLQGKPVVDLEVTTDGRFLATISADAVARLWSLESGELLNLVPHNLPIRTLALSTDGKLLATVTADQQLFLWRLDGAQLLADACERVDRNLSWAEWQQYFGATPYRKTCERRPLHASFLQSAFELASVGDGAGARERLQRARQLEPASGLVVEDELKKMTLRLDAQGQSFAEKKQIARAAQRFRSAALISGLKPYDYEQRARNLAVDELLTTAVDRMFERKAAEALGLVEQAVNIDAKVKIPATIWNSLCWYGAVYGHAASVLHTCDNAVELAGEDHKGFFIDSRAVARLVAGNTVGAMSDFNTFIAWAANKEAFAELAAVRQEWVEALAAGINPLAGMSLVAHSNYMAHYRMAMGLHYQLVNLE